MKEDIDSFFNLSASGQIKFLKQSDFVDRSTVEKIEFLQNVLVGDLSSKTIASGLKLLRELKFRQRSFYTKFLYHSDSSVANAARKAVEESSGNKDSGAVRLVDLVKNEEPAERMAMVKAMLDHKKEVKESVLISLLSIDDFALRDFIVSRITPDHQLDEIALVEAVKHSVWFVRASLVEILGRRKSPYLYGLADQLLNDKNVEVKLKFIQALASLDRDRSRSYLLKLKEDSNRQVQKEAEKTLATI